MEYVKFLDHMKESCEIDPRTWADYKQATVEVCGEVIAEDDKRLVVAVTKWTHSNGDVRVEDTWFIVKSAIIDRRKIKTKKS